jgi:hypothetical protein
VYYENCKITVFPCEANDADCGGTPTAGINDSVIAMIEHNVQLLSGSGFL